VYDKATCMEFIERKMSKYQECELQVLREYVVIEAAYPTSWVAFLNQKKVCVETFSAEVAECSHMFIHANESEILAHPGLAATH